MVRLLGYWLFACALAVAQPPVTELLERKTLAEIRAVAGRLDGVLGVAAIDLTTGRTLALDADSVFPQASAIKIPILVTLFRAARAGAFRLADTVTLTEKDAVGGSGRYAKRLQERSAYAECARSGRRDDRMERQHGDQPSDRDAGPGTRQPHHG